MLLRPQFNHYCEVVGRASCEVCPSRIHPCRLSRMARTRRQREFPGSHSQSRSRSCAAFSNTRHAPDRYPALRRRGPVALESPHSGFCGARGSTRLGGYREPSACTTQVKHPADESVSADGRCAIGHLEVWLAEKCNWLETGCSGREFIGTARQRHCSLWPGRRKPA